jgi:hypothetical protein
MRETYSINDIKDIFDSEGIGYAIQSYLSIPSIEDSKLARLINTAKELLDEIEAYVEDNYVPDDLDTDDGREYDDQY